MLTLIAFALALGLLITVHEFGHYIVAVLCGVKVTRFSVGFGKPLLRWKPKGSPTEFLLCAFPLGGYVKMLDERDGQVMPEERHQAFNLQPLPARVAIVVAGPAANLLLAVLLYAVVHWSGVLLPSAILARPDTGSIAARAGLTGGEKVLRAGFDRSELQEVRSYEDVHWWLTRSALERQDLWLQVTESTTSRSHDIVLRSSSVNGSELSGELFQQVGLSGPFTRPVMGNIMVGGAADRAGLRNGDVVRQVGAVPVFDGRQLRQLIRASVDGTDGSQTLWKVDRSGLELAVQVKPERQREGDQWVGKIGAYVGAAPEMVTVIYGPLDGLWRAMVRARDISRLTVRTMGKMLIGEASLKNLSGPLTIADYAGKSAGLGWTQYLLFLGLISVSLGVLNLLPLPLLDGGHLMYYLWEWITGKPVSDVSMERLQRGGFAVLLVMMSIAIFNDINRLFG
ncbi:MAG: RIP metalloprotease RseP [Comamonadaceae bacterium]